MSSSKPPAALELDKMQHAGARHARFIKDDVPLHIVLRVVQGRYFLRPAAELNEIVVGVLARGLQLYDDVELYGVAFLSNHAHLMLQGPPNQVPAFIGYIKREISYRWGHHPSVNRHGSHWADYLMIALPTAASQIKTLRYILSQGVKEGLVLRPQDWPGVHCAHALLSGESLQGRLLNATAYSRAVDAERRKSRPLPVQRADYEVRYSLALAPLPAWQDLDDMARHEEVRKLVDEVIREGNKARNGKQPVGAHRIKRMPLDHMTELAKPPWQERRRRLVCWSSPHDAETRAYLADYWHFQAAFREASHAAKRTPHPLADTFPKGAFIPGSFNAQTALAVAA